MKITIIGFGNIAHAIIAYCGSKRDIEISVYSSQNDDGNVVELEDKSKKGIISKISNDPSEILPNSDLILVTVPSYVRKEVLKKIAPYITDKTIIGAFPGIGGFYDEVKEIIGKDITVFASQRVPYIARTIKKGKLVKATPKNNIYIAVSRDQTEVKKLLSDLLDMDVILLDSFMEVHLTNSNPILHSARLYALLQEDIYPFKKEILFYEEWDDMSSKILLEMDREFMALIDKLQLKNIRSLKEHYGVKNVQEMTKKMSNIKAFKGIKVPLKLEDGHYLFDFYSRYFQEDIGHDLFYIQKVAEANAVDIPTIKKIYTQLKKIMENKI